jgi:hypothetical protein
VIKLFIFSLISLNSFAAPLCEVYGISDSPQSLTCSFRNELINLTCLNGIYSLGGETVEAAFHLEVEDGPTPLVFRTKSGDLTVTMTSHRKNEAVLSREGKRLSGNCRL